LTVCPQVVTDTIAQSAVPQTIEDLHSDLDSIMSEISTPGAAVAIVSADSIVWIGTFGFADTKTGEKVTENTHFCIGSCTKSFVGLGFLRLMDEGRVDINTPLSDIVPEIEIDNPWEETHPVRIIHLLEHTAGFDDAHPAWFYFEKPLLSLRQALNEKAHLRKVRWQPGTRFSYSSVGFTLAGYVLEKVTGRRYEDYLKQALLEPIGMKTATIGSSEEARRLLAVGYDKDTMPYRTWYDYDEPAGALNASIREMALFVRFLLNRGTVDGQQIISADLLDRIGRPVTTLASQAGLKSGYSFGFGVSYRDGAKWYTHGGAVPGFLAEYAYNLDHGLGYVVLQNLFDTHFHDDLFVRVRSYVASHVDSIAPPLQVPVPTEVLDAYCGYYEPRSPRQQLAAFAEILAGGITVSYENDTFYTQGFMEDKTALIAVSGSLFRQPDHPEASRVFTKTANGRMAYASRRSYYERTAFWKTLLYRALVFGAVAVMLSSIAYAIFWIPVHIYKKLKHSENRSKCVSMRLVPLLAVVSLILGTLKMGDQTILEFGMFTAPNAIFYVSTLLFAGLSTLSLFTTYRSFRRPVRTVARSYAVLLSASCFGMTLYLNYSGVIGLRLWAY
jgi:CubicO group peptidase (beta-lactamase class C family)